MKLKTRCGKYFVASAMIMKMYLLYAHLGRPCTECKPAGGSVAVWCSPALVLLSGGLRFKPPTLLLAGFVFSCPVYG